MCERIVTTTIIKLKNKVTWAKIRKQCCVVGTIVWNINH